MVPAPKRQRKNLNCSVTFLRSFRSLSSRRRSRPTSPAGSGSVLRGRVSRFRGEPTPSRKMVLGEREVPGAGCCSRSGVSAGTDHQTSTRRAPVGGNWRFRKPRACCTGSKSDMDHASRAIFLAVPGQARSHVLCAPNRGTRQRGDLGRRLLDRSATLAPLSLRVVRVTFFFLLFRVER